MVLFGVELDGGAISGDMTGIKRMMGVASGGMLNILEDVCDVYENG